MENLRPLMPDEINVNLNPPQPPSPNNNKGWIKIMVLIAVVGGIIYLINRENKRREKDHFRR